MKEFKGRVVIEGNIEGEAVVTKSGLNVLATFQKSALKKMKQVIAADQNNKDLYGKNLTDKVVCLPKTIGSTTGGMVLETVAKMGIAPKAFLFAEHIDTLAASGVILANVWLGKNIVTVDNLGAEFLNYVKEGMNIEIKDDGTVIIK